MYPKAKAEPVLVAWGIDTDAKPVFFGLAPGATSSADAWIAFLTDLTEWKMSAPLLVISVAVTGPCQRSIAALRPVSPQMHCRGLAERTRQGAQAREGDVKGDAGRASRASRAQVKGWSSKDAAGPGAPSPDGSRFPSAVPCVKDNLHAFPAYPSAPQRRIATLSPPFARSWAVGPRRSPTPTSA